MKNILIIGGSSGIGKQLALQLANSGIQVYATYNETMPHEMPSDRKSTRLNSSH